MDEKAYGSVGGGHGDKDNRGYTIDDALDTVGFGPFQWTLLLMSGVGFCTKLLLSYE